MRRMKTSLLWNWFWKITTKSMLFWEEKLPISENGVQLGKIRSPLRSVILSNCSILQGLIYQGMSASPWLSHPGPAKALNMSRKIWKCFLPPRVGIELNCEHITRNYQRIGSDLVVENLAVAGCLGAACDCWVGIMATSNSQNWGLEGGGVPTLTLAALFPATGSLTWTREENHPVRRRGWQDKIG